MAEVDALAMARPLLIVLASAVLLTLVLDRVFALGLKAGLIVSLLLVMFFSYGHFYDWLLQSFSVRHRFLLPIWIACWVPLLVMLVRTRRTLPGIRRGATVIAGTAVATSVLTIGGFLLNMTSRRVVPPLAPANITARVHGARLPARHSIQLSASYS